MILNPLRDAKSTIEHIVSCASVVYSTYLFPLAFTSGKPVRSTFLSNSTSTASDPPIRSLRSPGLSTATILPWFMIPTRSQSILTSSMLWDVRNIVLPSRESSIIFSLIIRALATSRPDVGSSRKSNSGSLTSAIESMSRCFIPFDRVFTLLSFRSEIPKTLRSSSAFASAFFRSIPYRAAVSIMFFHTERSGYAFAASGTTPIFSRALSVSLTTSKPRTLAFPESGSITPVNILTVVVFPAPFGPRKPNISPP